MTKTPTIVTHVTPDWDAIGSTWLVHRFIPEFVNATFHFVGQNEEESEIVRTADAVVDTGRELDPARLRFDHHQGSLGKTTCSTRQVYEYLCAREQSPEVARRLAALEPVVTLIFKADTAHFDVTTETSHTMGIHALLSGEKRRLRASFPPTEWDARLLQFGFGILDNLVLELGERLRWQTEQRGETVYVSADGLVAATRHGNNSHLFDQGVVLVVYEGEPFVVSGGETTHPVGVARSFEASAPHVGDLIRKILSERIDLSEELRAEMSSWWLHPAGFMGGRGSARAPRSTPVTIDVSQVARLLDEMWTR